MSWKNQLLTMRDKNRNIPNIYLQQWPFSKLYSWFSFFVWCLCLCVCVMVSNIGHKWFHLRAWHLGIVSSWVKNSNAGELFIKQTNQRSKQTHKHTHTNQQTIWVFPSMVVPRISTAKWWFLVGTPIVVGETHHFRKPPYNAICSLQHLRPGINKTSFFSFP